MIDPNDYPEPHCAVCKIPKLFAVSMTHVGSDRYLCDVCIEKEKNTDELRSLLAGAYDKLMKTKNQEKTKSPKIDSKFWD